MEKEKKVKNKEKQLQMEKTVKKGEKLRENTQKNKNEEEDDGEEMAKGKAKAETETERIRVRFWRGPRNGCHFKRQARRANHPILTQGGSTGLPCLVIGGKIDWFSFVFSLMGFESVSHDLKVGEFRGFSCVF